MKRRRCDSWYGRKRSWPVLRQDTCFHREKLQLELPISSPGFELKTPPGVSTNTSWRLGRGNRKIPEQSVKLQTTHHVIEVSRNYEDTQITHPELCHCIFLAPTNKTGLVCVGPSDRSWGSWWRTDKKYRWNDDCQWTPFETTHKWTLLQHAAETHKEIGTRPPLCPEQLWNPHSHVAFHLMGTGTRAPGGRRQTTHIHLVPRFRMRGAFSLRPYTPSRRNVYTQG
jgi:hypothetical protein